MSPLNGGGGGGRYLPSTVVVAQAEPGGHAGCCADADVMHTTSRTTAKVIALPRTTGIGVIGICLLFCRLHRLSNLVWLGRGALPLCRDHLAHRIDDIGVRSCHWRLGIKTLFDEKSRATRWSQVGSLG